MTAPDEGQKTNAAEKAAEKANDYAFEALKQVITLSSAILVFSVTFLKDFNSDPRYRWILLTLLAICWLLLLVSIYTAWVAMVDAAYALELMIDKIRYVFSSKTGPQPDIPPYLLAINDQRRLARRYATTAQLTFLAGLVTLVILGFVSILMQTKKESAAPAQNVQVTLEIYPVVISGAATPIPSPTGTSTATSIPSTFTPSPSAQATVSLTSSP